MSNPKVITTLLPEGEPTGLKIVQLAGWVGETLVVPRGNISKLFERTETQEPGIYFLFGESENLARPFAYIGQSGNVCNRIKTQAGDKDYWNTAVVFVGGLEGGDVQYLERRCFDIARSADRCDLRNTQSPQGGALGEARKISIESYLENIQFMISALGFPIFQSAPEKNTAEVFFCRTENADADARGTLMESGEFIVYKSSLVRRQERPGVENHTRLLRKELESEGILEPHDANMLIFTRDYIFPSPSAASKVVKAMSCNGWINWVSEDGKTLHEVKRQE